MAQDEKPTETKRPDARDAMRRTRDLAARLTGMGRACSPFLRFGAGLAGSARWGVATPTLASAASGETNSRPSPSSSAGRPKARPMSCVKYRTGSWNSVPYSLFTAPW